MERRNIYFVGIGGIGMSALARYFLHEGWCVAGYDLTRSELTEALEREGAQVHYTDDVALIGEPWRNPTTTTVVYTPAIPPQHTELNYFRQGGFEVLKRSQMLGVLTEGKYVMAVAGTHGKSSTSTLLAWLNHEVEQQGSAVLGAISNNFESNLVLGSGDRVVVEADEFDRSFLRLKPDVAVITSVDADHLDIYGDYDSVREAFSQFVDLIKDGGSLIIKSGVVIELRNPLIEVWHYSLDEESDFYISRIETTEVGGYIFDITTPSGVIEGCELGVVGRVNIENAVAAVAALWCAAGGDIDHDAVRGALRSFRGVKRRLELYVAERFGFYMDDYAHHPREIEATLSSVRAMLPNRHMTVIFQPHLYSRTNDLHEGFSRALSAADRVILLPIYPARELPMEGVDSQLIARDIDPRCGVEIVDRESIVDHLSSIASDVVVTMGAGNIDLCCPAIAEVVRGKSRMK